MRIIVAMVIAAALWIGWLTYGFLEAKERAHLSRLGITPAHHCGPPPPPVVPYPRPKHHYEMGQKPAGSWA